MGSGLKISIPLTEHFYGGIAAVGAFGAVTPSWSWGSWVKGHCPKLGPGSGASLEGMMVQKRGIEEVVVVLFLPRNLKRMWAVKFL